MQKITPFLWFDGTAQEAANFYVSAFKNSRIVSPMRAGGGEPTPEGKVIGKHEPTGQIPTFVGKLRKRGIKIDMGMFAAEGPAEGGAPQK